MNSSSSQQSPAPSLEERAGREVVTFAERLFKRLPEDLAARLPLQQRLDIAREAFEFFAIRSEPVKVLVRTRVLSGQPVTVIETVMPDCAFIVDSCREYLHQRNVPVMALLHPIFSVSRDVEGRLVSASRKPAQRSSASHSSRSLLETQLDGLRRPNLPPSSSAGCRRFSPSPKIPKR